MKRKMQFLFSLPSRSLSYEKILFRARLFKKHKEEAFNKCRLKSLFIMICKQTETDIFATYLKKTRQYYIYDTKD